MKHLGVFINLFKGVHAFQIELEFGSVGFEDRGKPDNPVKNLSEQRREPTTNSTHIWLRCWDLNLGHIGGRQVRHKCTTLAPHAVALRCSCLLSVLLSTQPSTLINIGKYVKVSLVSSVMVSDSMPLPGLSWLCTPLRCCFFSTSHGVFKEFRMQDVCHMNLV